MIINPWIQQKVLGQDKPVAKSCPEPKASAQAAGPVDKAMIVTPQASIYHAFVNLFDDEPACAKPSGPALVDQVRAGKLSFCDLQKQLDGMNTSQLEKTLDYANKALKKSDDAAEIKVLGNVVTMISKEISSRSFFDKLIDPMRNFDTRWLLA